MAFSSVRGTARVLPNSGSMAEARKRTFEFFKEACRALPSVMEIYNLHDVATVSQLRSTISHQIRSNSHVSDPKVIKPLIVLWKLEPVSYPQYLEHVSYRHVSHDCQIQATLVTRKCQKVIDMLLFKGMEELTNIVDHAKQRHHIIGQYVVGRGGLVQDMGKKDEVSSDFMKKFYASNYF